MSYATRETPRISSREEALAWIEEGREEDRRPLNNNTVAVKRGEAVAIRLHRTDVVVYHADGTVTLNSGGWKTTTTKSRINRFSPFYVRQQSFDWYVFAGRSDAHADDWQDRATDFSDRMRLQPRADGFDVLEAPA